MSINPYSSETVHIHFLTLPNKNEADHEKV